MTGLNEAFIITKEKRDELVEKDAKSDEIIRPILRGRDISKNSYEWAGLYIIATFPSRHYDIDDFPAVRDYLLTFDKRKLEQSGQKDIDGIKGNNARKKTNNRWFEVQDSIAYWDDFSKQKILFAEMVSSPRFYLDRQNFLVNDTVTFISGENLETLTIFLNSKIIFSIFKLFYAGGGLGNSGIRMKKTFLQKLPLPRIVIQNVNFKDQEILISKALTLTDDEFDYLLEAFSI